MANNFVSNANATYLMNAINQKKDTKPDTITWDEWIALTDEQREGTHYIITNVPASFSSKDAVFALRNVTLEFTNKTAVITDTRVTPDAYLFTFFYNEAVAQAAGIECTWGNGTITFTVDENPTSDIILDILAILPALATPTEGSGGHTIVGPTGTEMAQEDKLQFTGDVTVTDDSANGKTVVNITGGGHTIQNSQGTNMPPRSTMQFADAFLSDDSSALKTEIHMMQQAMTRAAFEDAQNLPDGMYPIKEEDPTVISADMVAYGDGTVEQALDDKVNKSGDTMSGKLTIDRQNGSTSVIGYSQLELGNNILEGVQNNSAGLIKIFGKNSYNAMIYDNIGLTADRALYLPNKSGTLALMSDIQDLKFPRQKNLGTFTTTAEIEAFLSACNVSTGKFDGDIQIGDYVTIAGYKCYVAGFNTEYNKGDTALTTNHISFVSNFGNSKMNETNTTANGYEGATTIQNFLSGKETELTAICGSHLLSRRCLTTNAVTNGKSSSWAWNSHKLTILTENQAYGYIQNGNELDTGEGYEKLPIFNNLSPTIIFGRIYIWLRGIVTDERFSRIDNPGSLGTGVATFSAAAVALFCIG